MRIALSVTQDQKIALSKAAEKAGLPLSLWIRAVSLAAARGFGIIPGNEKRVKNDGGIAERRALREAKRAAVAAEDAAYAEVKRLTDAQIGAAGENAVELRRQYDIASAAAVAATDRRRELEAAK